MRHQRARGLAVGRVRGPIVRPAALSAMSCARRRHGSEVPCIPEVKCLRSRAGHMSEHVLLMSCRVVREGQSDLVSADHECLDVARSHGSRLL